MAVRSTATFCRPDGTSFPGRAQEARTPAVRTPVAVAVARTRVPAVRRPRDRARRARHERSNDTGGEHDPQWLLIDTPGPGYAGSVASLVASIPGRDRDEPCWNGSARAAVPSGSSGHHRRPIPRMRGRVCATPAMLAQGLWLPMTRRIGQTRRSTTRRRRTWCCSACSSTRSPSRAEPRHLKRRRQQCQR